MTLRNRCRKLVVVYHRSYRRILCRFSRLIRLLGLLTVMASTVVKNRNELLTKVCCVQIKQPLDIAYPAQDTGKLTKGGQLSRLLLLLLLSYKEYNMNKQTTQCIENSAVRESYRVTVQSAEII